MHMSDLGLLIQTHQTKVRRECHPLCQDSRHLANKYLEGPILLFKENQKVSMLLRLFGIIHSVSASLSFYL